MSDPNDPMAHGESASNQDTVSVPSSDILDDISQAGEVEEFSGQIDKYKLIVSDEYLAFAKESLKIEPTKRDDSKIDSICYLLMELKSLKNYSYHKKLDMAKIATLQKYEPHDMVVKSGQEMDSFYIILSGQIAYTVDSSPHLLLSSGDTFGIPPIESKDMQVCSGFYITLDEPAELIVISVPYMNFKLSESLPAETGEELSDVEASYVDKLLNTSNITVIIDKLFDAKYYEAEPNFISDFFLTFKIYMPEFDILVQKIRECISLDTMRQRSISILLCWLVHDFEDFRSEYMMDFIQFVILKLRAKGIIMLVDALVHSCYSRSLGYEAHIVVRPDEDVPFQLKYRALVNHLNITYIELFVTKIKTSGRSNTILKLYDEIIYINDLCVKNLTLPQVRKIVRTSSTFIFIVKRCIIKYKTYKDELLDLYEIDDVKADRSNNDPNKLDTCLGNQLNVSKRQALYYSDPSTYVPPVETRKNTLFSKLTLRFNKKSQQKVKSIIDTSSNTSSTSSLKDVVSLFSNVAFNYDNAHDVLEDSVKQLEPEMVYQINSHFVTRIYSSNDDVKYLAIARSDSIKKIVDDYLNAVKIKRAHPISENLVSVESEHFYFMFLARTTSAGVQVSRLNNDSCNIPARLAAGTRLYVSECSSDIKISNDAERSMITETLPDLLTLDCDMFAKLLTFINFYMFTRITPKEYLATIIKKVKYDFTNLTNFERRCDKELMWVVSEILGKAYPRDRANIIIRFIKMAKCCLDLNNFNTFFSIVQGLEHNLISRLESTWALVPIRFTKLLNQLLMFCDPSQNMSNYRSWLLKCMFEKSRERKNVVIPFIPLIKKDLTFINDSMETFVSNNEINYRKIRAFAKELRKISYFREPSFEISNIFETKNKATSYLLNQLSLSICPIDTDNSIMLSDISEEVMHFVSFDKANQSIDTFSSFFMAQSNLKKIFDEFIMIKRIMQYLPKIGQLEYNIEELRSKSFEYEPSKRISSKILKSESISSTCSVVPDPPKLLDSLTSLNNIKSEVFKKDDSNATTSSEFGTLV